MVERIGGKEMIYIVGIILTVIIAFFLSLCIRTYNKDQLNQDERILYVEKRINEKDREQKQRIDTYFELVNDKIRELDAKQRQLERTNKKRG